jgi:catecholate siderophore receptor
MSPFRTPGSRARLFAQFQPQLRSLPHAQPGFAARPRSALHALAASCLLMFPLSPAWSQGTAAKAVTLPAVTISGQRDAGYRAISSSTATKTDTPLRDTPQSVSVVTQQQMRDQAVQSIAEAARYVPGVGFAQGEGNRETPIFRGVASTGDFFIDGVRDDVQYYRDLYNIERIEVFKGPNAMAFGRGATGGLINRVSKQPEWAPFYGASVTVGSHHNRRVTADVNQPLNDRLSLRVTGLYENSDSYRDGVSLERRGINPTLAWRLGSRTLLTLGYEYFKDERIADRGIPSRNGRPVETARSTFFGNAAGSPTWSQLDAFGVLIEHEFDNGMLLRNRTRWSDQDKYYQNVFPGAVTGANVSITAYDNATQRRSLFNQTDLIAKFSTGRLQHKLVVGAEFGEQETDNRRTTGFFAGNALTVNVPLSNPRSPLPVAYRPNGTDADNSGKATVAALYVQDQIELTPQVHLIGGVRYDRFDVDFRNNRTGAEFGTKDELVSPRVGLVYKPVEPLSLYANYSTAYQPRAGEQLSSLALNNAALRPERFDSYEIGAKWDVLPDLTATLAFYRLDRKNVIVINPAAPTTNILSDGQRTEGVELGLSGKVTQAWSVVGGYAYADAEIVADTTATLRKGATVGQVPRHTFALWNRYDFSPTWGAGVGVIRRTEMFATNELNNGSNVELPGYTRVDAAVFMHVSKATQLQLNVENLFDKKYYLSAHNNNNILPGSPRAFRLSLNTRF